MVAYLHFLGGGLLLGCILLEEASHVLGYLIERVELLLVLQELVSVYLVDEHLESNGWVHAVSHFDDLE